jgi:pimeloyl-ACP methyl ester carboxylesterase
MSAEAGSPITTYFRVCDGVRVRFADTRADSDVTVLLLAPWPESLWAFRRIWDRVSAAGRAVAIDMPGFGHSDGRSELIAPDASGAFLAGLIDEWGLGAPHVVGPDVGTAAALFLAANAPERLTSLTVGGGAVRLRSRQAAPSRRSSRRESGRRARAGRQDQHRLPSSPLREREREVRGLCQRMTSGAPESARFVAYEQNPVLRSAPDTATQIVGARR